MECLRETKCRAWWLACLLLAGCVPPAAVSLTPEAALPACESGALAELRRLDATAEGARLEPVAEARVENRTPPPNELGVTLVIAGRGTATGGSSAGPFSYTCLAGSSGKVLFVQVLPERSSPVLGECAGRDDSTACLRTMVVTTDATLAKAEAEAITAARRRSNGRRPEVDEPAAASIGAWRVYRDAECARRYGDAGLQRQSACLVELTRARINELRG